MKLETRIDGIILTAESAMDAQLLSLTQGELFVANWGYVCDNRFPGPSSTYIQFKPKSAARIRREKWAEWRYRLAERWRWLRSLRLRIVSTLHEENASEADRSE